MSKVMSSYGYSSKAIWYSHTCCSLKFLVWRLHHVFNIWTGAHYICAHIRQIIRCVYAQTIHSFWINFLMKLHINCTICIHDELMNVVSVCSNRSSNRLSYWKTAHMQLCTVSHSLLFGVPAFGVENGSYIADWISINLFTFGLSVGWKPVRKYSSYLYC